MLALALALALALTLTLALALALPRAGTAKPGARGAAEAERRGGTLLTRVRVILRLRGGGGRVGCN